MGTNYYLKSTPCPHCGKADEPLHIGKSSGGWAFQLHVIPECGINTLDDWIKRLSAPGTRVEDEYGGPISKGMMVSIIVDRKPAPHLGELLHATIGRGGCVGHGVGSWDYVEGDFS